MTLQQIIIKRVFDITVASFGLLFIWPIVLLSILIARLDTKMSGLFSQDRVGQHGKIFRVRKIRTMRAVSAVSTSVTVSSDPRITRVGKILRRLKIDELPQLWNVLVGEMSIVGPRPDVPGFADKLVGEQQQILMLKPGITGPATIKYSNEEYLLSQVDDPISFNDEVIFPDKVRINIEYLQSWSMLGDVNYILITLHALPKPKILSVAGRCERDAN